MAQKKDTKPNLPNDLKVALEQSYGVLDPSKARVYFARLKQPNDPKGGVATAEFDVKSPIVESYKKKVKTPQSNIIQIETNL